jgi:hypothetical protein
MSENGAEATYAPGSDLSLQATEMLLEDIASTVFGAEIEEVIEIHYDAFEFGTTINRSVQCKSLDAAFRNAGQLSKSSSVLPRTIKVTSYKKITTPRIEHAIEEEIPPDAPRWKSPESHPYIPTD